MNCCLWIGGVKVSRADEILNNFDLASLRGYFWGGSLVRWLYANGGAEQAKKLEETGCLEYAFGIREKPAERDAPDTPDMPCTQNTTAGHNAPGTPLSSFGSFGGFVSFGSFGSFGSFASGSGGYGTDII